MIVENLERYFNDFAVMAVINDQSIKIIFDETSDPMSLGSEGRDITALAITSEVTFVSHQDTLTIGGKAFEIVGINREMDGKLTELVLKEA
jgi:hypothetical protein